MIPVLPSSPGPGSPKPDPQRDNEFVEELVARILASDDASQEMAKIKKEHPGLFSRVEGIYACLVEEKLAHSMPDRDRWAGHSRGRAVFSSPGGPAIAGYEFRRILGRGGMGIVYLAEQIEPRRKVAIKLLRPDLLHVESGRERFRHEILAVARLQHPGIVQVFEAKEDAELPYFVMEYVDGRSLGEILSGLRNRDPSRLRAHDLLDSLASSGSRTSHLDADQSWQALSIHIGRELCEALAHAHERGVLHRDVKPSNVLLTQEGRARLVDFGLARLEGETRLTRSETELGSLPFIPPENLRGSVLPSESRDVYSLAVTLFEFLALKNPFLADGSEETRRRILKSSPPSLRHFNRTVSWELETVLQKAMSPEPEQRYASARDFGEDLARVSRRETIHARRPGGLLRAKRWFQRHPSLSGMIAVACLLVCASAFAFAVRENHARKESENLTRQAQHASYVAKIQFARLSLDKKADIRSVRALLASCPEELRGFEWSHIAQSLDSSIERVPIEGSSVMDMSWASDREHFALLQQDKEIRIYARGKRKPLAVWKPAELMIHQIAWRPTRQELAYVRTDGSVLLRSTQTDAAPREILSAETDPRPITRLEFSRDGRFLFTAHHDGHVKKIDVDEAKVLSTMKGDGLDVASLSVSADGRVCVVGTFSSRKGKPAIVLVHEFDSGRTHRFRHPGNLSVQAVIDAEGEFVYVASVSGVHLVNLTRRKVQTIDSHSASLIALSGDGSRLAFLVGTARLRILEIEKKRGQRGADLVIRSRTALLGHMDQVYEIETEPGSNRLWTAGIDPFLLAWDPAQESPVYMLDGPRVRVTTMAIVGDAGVLTGDRDGFLSLHERKNSRRVAGISNSEILDLTLRADGKTVLVVHEDGTLAEIDWKTGSKLWSRKQKGASTIASVVGGYVLGTRAGSVILHTDSAGDEILLEATRTSPVAAVQYHNRTGSLLLAYKDGRLLCLDLPSRQLRWQCQAHEGWIADTAIDPKGRYAVSIGQDRKARIWRLSDGSPMATLQGMKRAPLALAINPDGSRLATSSGYDREIRLWDPLRGAHLFSVSSSGVAFAIAFSKTLLASAGMSELSFGSQKHMGQIQCWLATTTLLPPVTKSARVRDLKTPPPPRIR